MNFTSEETKNILESFLIKNLTSPYHEIRLMSCHILALLDGSLNEDDSMSKVLPVCLYCEKIEISIESHRDILYNLRKLEYEHILLNDPHHIKESLHYLLGVLYKNFQLLWEPTLQLIASYARNINIQEFWPLFLQQLEFTTQRSQIVSHREELNYNYSAMPGCLQEWFQNENQDRIDHSNYRFLLWKGMDGFVEICEARNRDVTRLFLTFLEEEYFKNHSESARTWNVKQHDDEDEEEEEEDEDLEEEEEEKENVEENKEKSIKRQNRRKSLTNTNNKKTNKTKLLLVHMKLFSKFTNPKALYKEAELNSIYLEFLKNCNPEIQKVALECLFTYKPQNLLPYKEHLFGLIDDKQFKTTIVLFQLDASSELIQADHRDQLIPIVLRIVFAKMLTRTGTVQSSGKSASHYRRGLILRFLAGCNSQELSFFIHMAFQLFHDQIQDDSQGMIKRASSELDLEHCIPPRRLVSSLRFLNILYDQLGHNLGKDLIGYTFRVVLLISTQVHGLLATRNQSGGLHAGYVKILKSARSLILTSLTRIFEMFDRQEWTSEELEALFDCSIWPMINVVTQNHEERIETPTVLLKLFAVWCKIPRYHILLGKQEANTSTVISYIIGILVNDHARLKVINHVLDMVQHLLTLEETLERDPNQMDQEEQLPPAAPLKVFNVQFIENPALNGFQLSEPLNVGSKLLLPHISPILGCLQKRITKKSSLSKRDLVILTRVSELALVVEQTHLEWCETLLNLIIPIAIRQSSGQEDVIQNWLITIENLIKIVSNPHKFLRPLAALYGRVIYTSCRKQLIKTTKTLVAIAFPSADAPEQECLNALIELNAFDSRFIDQPDFNRRLDAFKIVQDLLEKERITLDYGCILIHSCYYIFHYEKDLALRDSASFMLRKLAPTFAQQLSNNSSPGVHVFISQILQLTGYGIRSKNEHVRDESIALLGEMSRQCPHLHAIFNDLSHLVDAKDPDVDFFENLRHLQSHRHGRALLKFATVARTQTFHTKTLLQIILPLVTNYLVNEKYLSKHTLVDSAIKAFDVICQSLPWRGYETLLRNYLAKLRVENMQFQKQLIRIIITILDAFHFDLSKADFESKPMDIDDDDDDDDDVDEKKKKKEEKEKGAAIEKEEKDDEEKPEEMEEEEVKMEIDEEKAEEKEGDHKRRSNRIVEILTKTLLPKLNYILRSHSGSGGMKEENDVIRIPVGLAIVKLLQKFPKRIMDIHLASVLLRLSHFLKSRLDSVRRSAREILQSVMISLGPKYLNVWLDLVASQFTRGYQCHVLLYTVHSIINAIHDQFQRGDLDDSLANIVDLCQQEIFGQVAEEKEVAQVAAKVFEARSTKSYETYQLLAQYITETCFTDLLMQLKEILYSSRSFKTVNKASECLRRIVVGLIENKFISTEALLKLSYGMANESISEFQPPEEERKLTEEQKARQRPDILLIPQAPKSRTGALSAQVISSSRTNSHHFVEFGVRLLHMLLKRDRVAGPTYRPFLDPLVSILKQTIESKHTRLAILAISCLLYLFKMPDLPSLREHVESISESIFKILHKFAVTNLSQGDNHDLVTASFKALTTLIRNVTWHSINHDQLVAALLYAEQDIDDINRQSIAFDLLRAILHRKLVADELAQVMGKVSKLSILSNQPHGRLNARQVFLKYMMDYPLGKKISKFIDFYLSQLKFKLQTGRESAFEMLHSMIQNFPERVITEHAYNMFIHIGMRISNDDEPECRKMAALCIKSLVKRLQRKERKDIFELCDTWMQDRKMPIREMGIQLCGILVSSEGAETFEARLPNLLPLIIGQFRYEFDPPVHGRFVRHPDLIFEKISEAQSQARDHLLYQAFVLANKLCVHAPTFLTDPNFISHVYELTDCAHRHLSYPHDWVRLSAAQLLGHIFKSLDINKIAKAMYKNDGQKTTKKINKNKSKNYLIVNPGQRIKSLILDNSELIDLNNRPEIIEQALKNLVYLGRILKCYAIMEKTKNNQIEKMKKSESKLKLSLQWMIRIMRNIINQEIISNKQSCQMRLAIFKWFGAILSDFNSSVDEERILLEQTSPYMMMPIVREITLSPGELMTPSHKELVHLAKQVAQILKNKLGLDLYTKYINQIQMRLEAKRAERRKNKKQEAITDPERAAKRKIEKQLKKKENKKRKLEELKGKKKTLKWKRKKGMNNNDDDDDI